MRMKPEFSLENTARQIVALEGMESVLTEPGASAAKR